MSAEIIINSKSPQSKGFSVSNNAVRVTAYGLVGNDVIMFKRVRYKSEHAMPHAECCTVFDPTPVVIGQGVDYQIGTCLPSLTSERNTIIIPYAGDYVPMLSVVESDTLVVEVEPVSGTYFNDKEKGIDPCGKKPIDTSWDWTGGERCNNHFIEREEKSNLGNIRWVKTEKKCGYNASVPIVYYSDCCGDSIVVYGFDPNETRDPDATVELTNCNGDIIAYIYPTAGDGHTEAITYCNGQVLGYAVNRSDTAPLFPPPCLDKKSKGCNCHNTPAENGQQKTNTIIIDDGIKKPRIRGLFGEDVRN